jgi:threonine dehydrogenase-like Zn-dependent dehydrogenase
MPPRPGAFAEYVRIPERNVVPIPDTLSFFHAALAEPVAVSWHAVRLGVERLHQPLAACRVVVLGGGAIGLAAAIVARHFGARDVRVGEVNALRRETIIKTEKFSVFTPNTDNQPKENTIDLVIDAVGAAATRACASAMVRPGGVIVHAGLLPGLDGLDIRKITLQEITLTGTYCYTPTDFIQTVDALSTQALGGLNWFDVREISEGAQAFRDIDNGSASAPKLILSVGK